MGTKADLLGWREPGTGKLAVAAGVWEGSRNSWERSGPSTVSWSSRLCVEPPIPLGQAQARLLKAPSLCPSCLLQHLLTRGRFPTTVQEPLDRVHPWRQPAWVPLHGPGLAPHPGTRVRTRACTVKVCAPTCPTRGVSDDPPRGLPFSCVFLLFLS